MAKEDSGPGGEAGRTKQAPQQSCAAAKNDSLEEEEPARPDIANIVEGKTSWDYLEDGYYTTEEREELEHLVLAEKANRLSDTEPSLNDARRWHRSEAVLGRGTYGMVFEGIDSLSGEIFAVKQVDSSVFRPKAVRALQREMEMLRMLQHANIVRYKGMEVSGNKLSLFMELCPGGSISNVLDTFGALSYLNVRNYTFQIVAGLDYLHRHCIVHRDVKCANALLNSHGVVKLADFGASQWLSNPSTGSLVGTARYIAPEVLKGEAAGRKADIWSLGCCVVEMFTLGVPFSDQFSNEVTLLRRLSRLETAPKPPDELPDDAKELVQACFSLDCELRPSARGLRKFKFIAGMSEVDEGGGHAGGAKDGKAGRGGGEEEGGREKGRGGKGKEGAGWEEQKREALRWLKKMDYDRGGKVLRAHNATSLLSLRWPPEQRFSEGMERQYQKDLVKLWGRESRRLAVVSIAVLVVHLVNLAHCVVHHSADTCAFFLALLRLCATLAAAAGLWASKPAGEDSKRADSLYRSCKGALLWLLALVTVATAAKEDNTSTFIAQMALILVQGRIFPSLAYSMGLTALHGGIRLALMAHDGVSQVWEKQGSWGEASSTASDYIQDALITASMCLGVMHHLYGFVSARRLAFAIKVTKIRPKTASEESLKRMSRGSGGERERERERRKAGSNSVASPPSSSSSSRDRVPALGEEDGDDKAEAGGAKGGGELRARKTQGPR